MLEILLCSLVTVLPDFLYRRYAQGKRIGQEITLFSVWFELRWGLTGCLMLAVMLFTIVFYYHPTTSNVRSFFRTVTILPEQGGRVVEVEVANGDRVEAGQVLFRLNDSRESAAVAAASSRIAEVEANLVLAQSELAAAEGVIAEATGSRDEAQRELARKEELNEKNPNVVSGQELDQLRARLETRNGSVAAAEAQRDTVAAKISTLLPAQKASAEAQLAEAEAALAKTIVHAGVTGRVEQFVLRVGDYVSPVLRPAGILIPEGAGRHSFQASFPQVTRQVLHTGMIAEITCVSKPFTVVPMVVSQVQDVIAAGQFRPSDNLAEARPREPGTVLVYLEPLYEGQTDDIPPGSACMANAYTSNHERLASGEVGGVHALFLHAVDTVGVIHAAGLRIRALLLPVQTLVLSGH